MIAGLWPTPIADIAAAIVGALVVGLLRAYWHLAERVSRIEGQLRARRDDDDEVDWML